MMSLWEGLEEVVAIADAGTFVGAASVLGVSTSHVSRVISKLETRLGMPLFYRTTRRVSLTDTGRAFADQSRQIIQERDELLSLVNGAGDPQGELRITCSIALGERFVAPIVRRFTESHLKLSVSLDLTNRVADIVGEGYDVGIRTGQIADRRLAGRKIASRPKVVCAAPAYLARNGEPEEIAELINHDCLIGTSATWQFMEGGTPRSITPKGRWRCNSGAAVLDAAIAGMGICQLPTFYVRQAIVEGSLCQILDDFRAETEAIWAVYPHRRHLLPKVRNLVDILETDLQTLMDSE